ncbi:MAG: ParB N-terminal domain-containing protein [Pseudomonadota bacterium]
MKTLAELMATPEDCSPIEVIGRGERFQLVFGGHRLAAAKANAWATIPAIVKEASAYANEAAITLREITENLARRELSVLDRAVDIARWRGIYEAVHGTVRKGRPTKMPQVAAISEDAAFRFASTFSEAAKRALGLSRDTIERAMRIASIPADLRDQIALHAVADNQSELLQLAAEPIERQREIVQLLTKIALPAENVAAAIAIMDRTPERPREAAWQKLSTHFSRLKEAEQDRFFNLHEAAVQRWLANRRAS